MRTWSRSNAEATGPLPDHLQNFRSLRCIQHPYSLTPAFCEPGSLYACKSLAASLQQVCLKCWPG